MFVRFRQQGRRLQASLMQTRRVAGKMQNEHIASLGSVDADVSVRERIAFWIEIEERLARRAAQKPDRVGRKENRRTDRQRGGSGQTRRRSEGAPRADRARGDRS